MAVAGASVVAAISNFVLMFIGTRTLPDAEGTEFLAFWSLLTGMFGILSGIQNETVRAVGAVAGGREPGTRAIWPALLCGGVVAVLIAAAGIPIATRVVPLSASVALPALVIVTVGYAAYVTLVGSFGGRGWWYHYAGLLTGEVMLRVGLLVAVLLTGAVLGRYELAAVGATSILVVSLVCSPRARTAMGSRTDRGFGAMVRTYSLAMVSTASTALLITAYGAIVQAVGHGADPLIVGGLILAVSLTRAPIMIPLTAFTGVAIRIFLEHRNNPLQALSKPAAVLLGLGIVGGAAAWFVGPWFVPLFNAGYQIPGWVFGLLTFSSAFMAILTLLGTVVLALDAHGVYATGWLSASAVAIGILLMPLSLTVRVVASLAIGPVIGAAVMLAWVVWHARTNRATLDPTAPASGR